MARPAVTVEGGGRCWREVALLVAASQEGPASDLLELEFGQSPAVSLDGAQRDARISVYWRMTDAEVTETRAALRRQISDFEDDASGGLEGARISIRKVPARDWSESWKRHFHPICVGRLLVLPTWSRRRVRSDQAVIRLNPGLSFGTGQHPTTRFCLAQIAATGSGGALLDVGCGSGILALAAARLGCSFVRAIDNDPEAVRIATENAVLNGLEAKVRPETVDLATLPARPERQYDVVCANLVADLLQQFGSRLTDRVAQGGALVAAGILAAEFGRVEAAFSALGFKLAAAKTEGEWRSGVWRRLTPRRSQASLRK